MMHKKNLVAAIKVNGKVLRESNDRVQLPFGSEYSILLKNLDTVRQQVQIQIDGKETSGWIVLNPGDKQDLERFPGNQHKFKFIERTEAVEIHRGIAAEDGLIRIEFKREVVEVPPVQTWIINTNNGGFAISNAGPITTSTGMRSSVGASSVSDMWKYSNSFAYTFAPSSFDPSAPPTIIRRQASRGGASRSGACGQSMNSTNPQAMYAQGSQNTQCSTMGLTADANVLNAQAITFDKAFTSTLNDTGITVDGSLSDQEFHSVANFDTEDAEVLVLHLIGRHGDVPVQVARTVRIKLGCPSCGLKTHGLVKFCSRCGTNLEQV